MNVSSRLQRLLCFLLFGLFLVTGLQAQNKNDYFRQQQQQRQQELDRQRRDEADRRRQELNRQRQAEADRRRQELDRQRREAAELRRQELERRRREAVDLRRQELDKQRRQSTRQPQTQRSAPAKASGDQPTQSKGLATKLLQGKAQATRGQTAATTLKTAADKKTLDTARTKQRLEKVKKLAKDRKLAEQRIKKTRTEKLQREAKAELAEEQAENATQLIAAKRDSVKATTSSVGGGGKKTLDRLKSLPGKRPASKGGKEPPGDRGKADEQRLAVKRGESAAMALSVRQQYENEVLELKDVGNALRAAGTSAEDTARMLHKMRRDLGVKYKNLTPPNVLEKIHKANIRDYGDPLGPSIEFYRKKGKTWEQIIEGASKPGDLKRIGL